MIILKRTVVFAILWLALTQADPAGFLFGAAAVPASVWLSLRLLPARGRAVRLTPLAAMLPGFLWRSAAGAVDVALRALRPSLPVNPSWVLVPTRLREGGARAALGGEFSLMPGTLVAGSRGDMLLVHCLSDTDAAPVEAAVRAEEERLLRALNGDGPEAEMEA